MENHPSKVKKLVKTYPFIEIYSDPLNEYKISWFYPEKMKEEEKELIETYFGDKNYIEESQLASFLASSINPEISNK